ncbi:MAG: chromosomal replication initiator protein DnaA [Bacteroidota bacterium]
MSNDAKQVWSQCLEAIKEKVSEQSFRTWFLPIIPYKYESKKLTIRVPSQFFYEWIESHYANLLREVINEQLGKSSRLIYQVIEQKRASELAKKAKAASTQKKGIPRSKISLNPFYTFENLIVWDGNEVAQAASLAVADNPGKTSFNPLMIHSNVGMGKTHTMQAIAHKTLMQHSNHRVFYTTGENFTAEFIKNLRSNSLSDFLDFYASLDLLLIDDVQFLGGKEKTQEIFFNIFNQLHQNGRQIVMSSDVAPRDLVGFKNRLLSRFKWGLTTELQAPNLETRVAIIQSKSAQHGLHLEKVFINRLASAINSNIREIEGAITSLSAYSSLNKKQVSSKLVEQVIHNIVQDIGALTIDSQYLQKVVAKYFNVPTESLKSKARTREFTTARHVAMYLVRCFMPDMTLQAIGQTFGRRDHSTVSYAIKTVEYLMASDRNFRNSVVKIKKTIQKEIPEK